MQIIARQELLNRIKSSNNPKSYTIRLSIEDCFDYNSMFVPSSITDEELFNFIEENGTRDKYQSGEEKGAIGIAYYVTISKLLDFINSKNSKEHIENQFHKVQYYRLYIENPIEADLQQNDLMLAKQEAELIYSQREV